MSNKHTEGLQQRSVYERWSNFRLEISVLKVLVGSFPFRRSKNKTLRPDNQHFTRQYIASSSLSFHPSLPRLPFKGTGQSGQHYVRRFSTHFTTRMCGMVFMPQRGTTYPTTLSRCPFPPPINIGTKK